MRKLLFTLIATIYTSIAFAGPFGIEMGMTLAQIRRISKTIPEPVGDNKYYITPPKTNDMFEKYLVQIDPDYGVCWLKGIGKDIYTNGYGERLLSTFENLVESIRKTYGEETAVIDELKEGSIWGEPENFMYALQRGDRTRYTAWAKSGLTDLLHDLQAQNKLWEDPNYRDRMFNLMADSVAFRTAIEEKKALLKRLPNDISIIGVFINAISTSKGYISLEYKFSNYDMVEAKADSVF